MTARALDVDQAHLPHNPQAAARALHRAVIELCIRAGVPPVELVENYNDRDLIPQNADVGNSIERCLALLSLFHARSIQTP
jgi:hypothetical protein